MGGGEAGHLAHRHLRKSFDLEYMLIGAEGVKIMGPLPVLLHPRRLSL